MIILSNIMNFLKNTTLNYIIAKKYIFVIIFTTIMCFNYIIIDKIWMHKFMYVKYLSISKDLTYTHVKNREVILDSFTSSFHRNNTNPNLKILNLKNGYDLKINLFSSLNKNEVNKLIDDHINIAILDIKEEALESLNFHQNNEILLMAKKLTLDDIKSKKILIQELSKRIKIDFEEFKMSSKLNMSEVEKDNLIKFLENIKNFIKTINDDFYLSANEKKDDKELYNHTYDTSIVPNEILKDLSICKFTNLNYIKSKSLNYFERNKICQKQKNIFHSSLEYFYYVYNLKGLINTNYFLFSKSIEKISDEWANNTIIDYDKEDFYEINRIGPSSFLIIVISIFNSSVITVILSLLLRNLNNKSNIFKN